MSSLKSWQKDFLQIIQQKEGLSPALKVYRNNTLAGLKETLEAVYPVLVQLVGEECFDGIAQRYQQHYWPSDTNLNQYGHQMAAFLAGDPVGDAVPYLPDMARLEFVISEVSDAADMEVLTAETAQAAMQTYGEALTFMMHPACAVLQTEWPVADIWRQHQDAAQDTQSIDSGTYHTFIQRNNGIVVTNIDIGTYTLISELNNGSAFTTAAENAAKAHPGFDLVAILQTALANGWFSRAEATKKD